MLEITEQPDNKIIVVSRIVASFLIRFRIYFKRLLVYNDKYVSGDSSLIAPVLRLQTVPT